jgi:glc operon protein GlcG
MKRIIYAGLLACAGVVGTSGFAAAQTQKPALTLADAKRVAAAANAEAVRNQWSVVITVLDDGGHALYLERMDNVQTGSVEVALAKAKTAVMFRRSTKVFADRVAQGNPASISMPNVIAVDGGEPIVVGGQVVGAIGVSGVTADQDGQIARAGAAVFKP